MEALSRGAARVVFVERAAAALKVLRGNLAGLGLKDGTMVRAESVAAFLRRAAGFPFDVIFLDPPYDAEGEYDTTLGLLGGESAAWLNPSAVVIAEHRRRDTLKETYGALERTRLLEQGDAAMSFYVSASQHVSESASLLS